MNDNQKNCPGSKIENSVSRPKNYKKDCRRSIPFENGIQRKSGGCIKAL